MPCLTPTFSPILPNVIIVAGFYPTLNRGSIPPIKLFSHSISVINKGNSLL
jgi:hypothetical protein